jgi:hypothetical protein
MTDDPKKAAAQDAWQGESWKTAAKDFDAGRPPPTAKPKAKRKERPKAKQPRPALRVIENDGRPAEDGARVLDDVHTYIGRFVAYPSPQAHDAHALWIAHAHMMDAWDTTPRIAFLSPEPGSGKTRALEVTAPLVPLPVEAINVTPAYLFRKVGSAEGLPTILFDEIDTVFGPKAADNEEIRALLNAGHRKGAVAGRCVVRGKIVETEEIPAYSALAMAGLGWLPDTLMSRSVIIRMRRRRADEKVQPFRLRQHGPPGEALKRRLEVWAAKTIDAVTGVWPTMPAGIEDRAADVWEALLAVADAAGGQWPDRARVAAVTLVAVQRDAQPSLGVKLLADIKTVFDDTGRATLPSKVLIASLVNLEESPWGDMRGRQLDERGLARRLVKYEVKPKLIRLDDGVTVLRGYSSSDFHDAWARYCASPPQADLSVTSVTSVTDPPPGPSAVTAVTVVTDKSAKGGDSKGPPSFSPAPAPAPKQPLRHVCAHCLAPHDGSERQVAIGGESVWLHPDCERPYADSLE